MRTSNLVGGANAFVVALDGTDIFRIGSGEHAEFPLPAGNHRVTVKCFGGWSPTWKEASVPFDAAAGKTSYFRVSPDMNCAGIEAIAEGAAKKQLTDSSRIDLLKSAAR